MKKLLILLMFICLFISCEHPISDYKGGVIHEKDELNKIVKIEIINDSSKNSFKSIYVSKYDFDRFNVGDTIK